MSWVRIHDGAMGNLKILRLTATAFRLWIRGLCYCQQHLTDGLIPREALRFLDAKRADVDVLCSVLVEGKSPLWERIEGFGFKVHDYLEWNDSREVIEQKRVGGRLRVARHREKPDPDHAASNAVSNSVSNALRNAHTPSGVVCITTVSNTKKSEGESEGKPSPRLPRSLQAGRIFLHRWQLDNLIATLGPHAETFGLDTWLDDLNHRIADRALPRDPWKFVQAELHEELARRGVAVASLPPSAAMGKQTTRLAQALANIKAQEAV